MSEKKCSLCGNIKPLEDFVASKRTKDGRGYRCKPCHKIAAKASIIKNPINRKNSIDGYYKRNKKVCNKRVVSWQKNNPEKVSAIKARTRIVNADKIKAYVSKTATAMGKKMREKFPQKYKSRTKLGNAVARGIIPAASKLICIDCEAPAKEYHHHMGYDNINALNVIPVCKKCHVKRDKAT